MRLSAPKGINQPFGRIHRRYRLLNTILSFGLDAFWRKRAMSSLRLPDGSWVLDVGCGQGDMLKLLQSPVRRVGLDPEIAMLRGMHHASPRPSEPVCGRAEEMPFAGGRFGALTAAFALRNFSDRKLALGEWFRVMKSGGQGIVIEFSPPERALMGRLVRLYLRLWLPLAGGIVSGDFAAYRYLSRTALTFPPPVQIAAELAGAGFQDIAWRRLIGQVAVLYYFRKR